MIETHPFGNFVPKNAKYLLLGSFTTKQVEGYDWFYANNRNHFWPILSEVYNCELNTREKQQNLFKELNMAIADIILSCERANNSNLDSNLTNITYNTKEISNIFERNNVEKVFFTSRFVETMFKRLLQDVIEEYPKLGLVYMPSPSPRYAAMNMKDKVGIYKKALPML